MTLNIYIYLNTNFSLSDVFSVIKSFYLFYKKCQNSAIKSFRSLWEELQESVGRASGVCGKSFRSLWEELQESEGGASVVCGRSFRSLKEGLQ